MSCTVEGKAGAAVTSSSPDPNVFGLYSRHILRRITAALPVATASKEWPLSTFAPLKNSRYTSMAAGHLNVLTRMSTHEELTQDTNNREKIQLTSSQDSQDLKSLLLM